MDYENLLVDAVSDWQPAKKLRKQIVHLRIVLLDDLTFEAIHLIELLSLMVTSRHEEVLRVAYLPGKHRENDLTGKRASVDEVTVEEVRVLFRGVAVQLENIKQVVVLPVDVATNCYLLEVVERDVD